MPGNQIAMFSVSGRRLAAYLELDLDSPIWADQGVNDPLREERISELIEEGEGLAPEPGHMGHDLETVEAHEERIAWLVNSDSESWAPLEMETGQPKEDGTLVIDFKDGHHRLLSTLFYERRVTVRVGLGSRETLDALVLALKATWEQRPDTALFGEGVFPAPGLGENRYIEVRCAPDKIWIDDLTAGVSYARYGSQLWTVEQDPLADVSGERRAVGMRDGKSEEDHLARFYGVCQEVMGVSKKALAAYCQELIK